MIDMLKVTIVLIMLSITLLGENPPSPAPAPAGSIVDSDLIRNFKLLNEVASDAPAKIDAAQIAPFGALVVLTPNSPGATNYTVSTCTTTHIKKGVVLTAAHCTSSVEGAHHVLIFYDKKGGKKSAYVPGFLFIGDGKDNPKLLDIATFKLSAAIAEEWDDAGGIEIFTPREIAGQDGAAHSVTIWSYSPMGDQGMQFSPNRCFGSTKKPVLEAWSQASSAKAAGKVAEMSFVTDIAEGEHVFMDNCQRIIAKGNSGSLITLTNNFRAKIGVANSILAEKSEVWKQLEQRKVTQIGIDLFYRSTDNKLSPLTWDSGEFLLGSGSLLETLVQRMPGAVP